MLKRVVITGLGAVTPIGNTLNEYWEGLKEGRNGAGLITRFDTSEFGVRFACEVKDFNSDDYIEKKAAKRMDLFTQYAVASAAQAVEDAGFDFEKLNKERVGVIYGSGIGGMQVFEDQHNAYLQNGAKRVSPFFVPMMISDIAAGHISIQHGFKGPNYAVTSACATSGHAIADATMLIQRGMADVMVSGGSESAVTKMSVAGFSSAKTLSTWNDRYMEASRPFDKDRNGFVIGEGSGTLILESLEHAQARGAKIYGEVVGLGLSGDAYHITAPAPGHEGAVRSMNAALTDAGVKPEDIDYVNAHGTSTGLNDLNETQALKTVFGDYAKSLAISSTKSMTGHLLGAAGAVEAIACMFAIKNSFIPPTINLDENDPECDLNFTPKTGVEKEVTYALSNSFGFGGHNASLLFKKFMD